MGGTWWCHKAAHRKQTDLGVVTISIKSFWEKTWIGSVSSTIGLNNLVTWLVHGYDNIFHLSHYKIEQLYNKVKNGRPGTTLVADSHTECIKKAWKEYKECSRVYELCFDMRFWARGFLLLGGVGGGVLVSGRICIQAFLLLGGVGGGASVYGASASSIW